MDEDVAAANLVQKDAVGSVVKEVDVIPRDRPRAPENQAQCKMRLASVAAIGQPGGQPDDQPADRPSRAMPRRSRRRRSADRRPPRPAHPAPDRPRRAPASARACALAVRPAWLCSPGTAGLTSWPASWPAGGTGPVPPPAPGSSRRARSAPTAANAAAPANRHGSVTPAHLGPSPHQANRIAAGRRHSG